MNMQKYFAKVSSFLYFAAFAVMLFIQNSVVLAAIIPGKVISDNPMDFEIVWTGNGLDDSEDNDALIVPELTNWQIGPDPIILSYEGDGEGWAGILTVQHMVAPHGVDGIGDSELFNISFDQLALTNSIIDKNVPHGDGDHRDFYTLTYTYVPVDDNRLDEFSVTLTGIHVVPIPAAFWLFGSALIGFMGLRMKRNFKDT